MGIISFLTIAVETVVKEVLALPPSETIETICFPSFNEETYSSEKVTIVLPSVKIYHLLLLL